MSSTIAIRILEIGILGYLAAPLVGGPVADAIGYGAVAAAVALTAVGVAALLARRIRP
ncbi:hypothetical protein [Streptomyces sp. NPDC057301]|uniref:hypothetical protein n=1 Tax=Streptomyces sp. NPDC057301 TaxID=3346093 RepID=UPI0036348F3A